jgi:RNA polymerase sigma factor (sigma-70 family)
VTRPISLLSDDIEVGTSGFRADETASAVAYEAFVRRHCVRLVQSLTLVALDRELAADAAQDAFLQLHLSWDKVQSHRDPVAWLYRVGINRCKDYRRRLARTKRLLTRLVADLPPESEAVQWESRLEALAILERLPHRQRVAAALFYEADFSVADIATAMNISEGAVKSHLSRAREALRKVLEEG